MSNRFHSKYHRSNHHTLSSEYNVDSSHDPIASPDHPFKGTFVIDSSTDDLAISAHGNISMNGFSISGIADESISFESGVKISALSNVFKVEDATSVNLGKTNTIGLIGNSTIAGGINNTISTGSNVTIGGGSGNTSTGNSNTIVGGSNNSADSTGGGAFGHASILGGSGNTATGGYSTILGGSSNTARGHVSIAGGAGSVADGTGAISLGYSTSAHHDNSVVIGGTTAGTTISEGSNTVKLSGTSGVTLGENVTVVGNISAAAVISNGTELTPGGGGGGLSNVVEDTTPQLGGNLDLNSNDITGTGNINISAGNLTLTNGTVSIAATGLAANAAQFTVSNDTNGTVFEVDEDGHVYSVAGFFTKEPETSADESGMQFAAGYDTRIQTLGSEFLRFEASPLPYATTFNALKRDTDFYIYSDINADTPFFMQGSDGYIGIHQPSPTEYFHVGTDALVDGNITALSTVSAPEVDVQQVLKITPQSSGPSTPEDGMMFYSSVDNKLYLRAAGAWVALN